MAEFGAHLSLSLGEKPSIFEVLACDGLANGLRAAFKHFTKVLGENNPEKYSVINRFSDEIYAALDLIVQSYHLIKYNASFSENFYGLKRTVSRENPIQLPASTLIKSVGLLVVFPYVLKKVNEKYEKLKESQNDDAMKTMCLKYYPIILFTGQFLAATYQFKFAVGQGKCHSPLLKLAGCQLKTLTQSDLDHFKLIKKETLTNWSATTLIIKSFGKLASVLTTGISVGAFFLQFLEWWYAQESLPKNLGSLPIPDAPVKRLSLKSGTCPICDKTLQNLTLLTISGIVFCYRCIHQSISINKRCPVTGYPATLSQLVKLYPPSD